MASKDTTVGYHPVGAPHVFTKRCGNPTRMQHNSVQWHRVVLIMTLGLMDSGKAGDFGLILGMFTY